MNSHETFQEPLRQPGMLHAQQESFKVVSGEMHFEAYAEEVI